MSTVSRCCHHQIVYSTPPCTALRPLACIRLSCPTTACCTMYTAWFHPIDSRPKSSSSSEVSLSLVLPPLACSLCVLSLFAPGNHCLDPDLVTQLSSPSCSCMYDHASCGRALESFLGSVGLVLAIPRSISQGHHSTRTALGLYCINQIYRYTRPELMYLLALASWSTMSGHVTQRFVAV